MTPVPRKAWPAALAAVLFAVLQCSAAGPAAAEQRVRVGVYQNAPKVDYGRTQGPEGIFVDLIEAVARDERWTLEYVPGTFEEGIARVQRGEIDLMPDVARTPAREMVLAFPREPVLNSWSQVYARRGSGIKTVLDLSGKRVAVLQGSVQQDILLQMAAGFGVQPALQAFADFPSAFRAVEEGRADAVVSNPYHGNLRHNAASLEATAIIFAPSQLYFAARKGGRGDLIAALDRRLAAYKADPHSVYFESLRRWTTFERAPQLPWWFRWAAVTGVAVLALCLAWALTLQRAALRLRTAERAQRQLAEELARIFDRSLDVICVLDARLRFMQVSRAMVQLCGRTPDELKGTCVLELVVPDERERARAGFERILAGAVPQLLESRCVRHDGSIAQVVWSAAWSQAQGEMYCIARDESERRQLLERLQTRSEQLQRANEDLQTFAQSVSHDLRAPLAAVSGFVAKVVRDDREQLAPGSLSLLQRVQAAAARMEHLIEDLLRLARLAEEGVHRRPCDLSAIAAEVVDVLRHVQPQRQVQVAIEPALQVCADPRLARLALENLLGNAWKFTARVPDPQVALGREWVRGEAVFFVRDNGAGFPMEYAAKLFVPFQRLHGRDEYEGTGIGLSIVHRVVTRHGGRIWAESGPGRGAVFRFTLGEAAATAAPGDAISRGGSPPSSAW